jgi:ketosteroid isomerase-like protein
MLVCLLFFTIALSACSVQTIPSRPPLSADEIKGLNSKLEHLANANLQAWVDQDSDLMRQIYTEDAVHHDANTDLITGLEDMIQFSKSWRTYFPKYESRLEDTFIDQTDGFYVEASWGWSLECYMVRPTSDNPIINYMWLTLRDGKIAVWWLFYAENTCKNIPFDAKLLQDYVDAWSSGDPQTVSDLYAEGAIRQDSLFGESLQGNQAINQYASDFFSWYPGVRLTLLNSFGELPKEIKRGGVYSVQVSDQSGKPCEVKMLVVLEPDESEQRIAQEWVFYNADSLIACGWAQ